jgi:uncharacterized transporter YbjL
MLTLVEALRENPELALFLTLAVGFLIDRLRLGTFRLGNVVGTLLAGVMIGQTILLGACAGAGTVTAALRAVQGEAHSKLRCSATRFRTRSATSC